MPIPTVDETVNMTIDEKIRPQTLTAPPTFDISVPVVPGHDMVINHLDGTQELGTGNEALAVASQEAESGQHVPLSAVQPQPVESVHRSVSDPEVNGPDQVALKAEVAAAQAANAAPAAPPATEEPETPVEPEVPVEAETVAPTEPVNPPEIVPVDGPSTLDPVTLEPVATPTEADVEGV